MESVPLIMRVMASSVKIVDKAGQLIRGIMGTGKLDIVVKGENDFQTKADRTAEACIISSLQKRFPGIKCIGEEGLNTEQMNFPSSELELADDPSVFGIKCPDNLKDLSLDDIIVWVDPLDGTKEFTEGEVDHVTVLVGISVHGNAIGGVIHQPWKQVSTSASPGRTIWSLAGLGQVFGLDKAANASGHTLGEMKPGEHNVICTTRSHSNAKSTKAVEDVRPSHVERVGGCGHKVLLLVEQRCHGYVFATPGCKKWDTCAPEVVLREAGGELTDMYGRRLVYSEAVPRMNEAGVLAAGRIDWHAAYLRAAGWS